MATYYWVGGTGTWDASDTTNWSASSGGAGGAGAPNNTDTVIFDAASGAGTCTTASGSACATATLDSSTLGLTLGANHTMSGIFTLTSGSIDLGSFVLTCLRFSSSNSNTRSIAFGTGNITITGNNAAIWNMGTATGFTYTGTPTVNCTYSGSTGSRTLSGGNVVTGGGTEFNCVSFNITAGTDTIVLSSSNAIKNIDFTGFAGTRTNTSATIFGNCTFSTGMTLTAGANALTFAATSGTQQITTNGKTLDFPITQNGVGGTVQLQDNLTMGSTRTFTLTNGALDLSSGNRTLSTGVFSSTNANVRSIAFGTGNITLTQNAATIWNTVTSTNFSVTGTPTVNVTYAGSTGTRTINGGGVIATSEANAINFNISAGSDTVAVNNALYKNLNFTGFSGAITTSSTRVYGNLTIPATVTSVTGNLIQFAGTSGTQTVVTNGITIASTAIQIVGGSTVVFDDALTATGTSFAFTLGTIKFKSGVTSTVSNFTTSGTTQKFLQSTTPGSQATLSQASGTVDVSYLTIQDSNATGGATWNAYVNQQNIDAGNNDGWDFGISPIVGSYEYTYQLRSFTQPRRF